MAVVRAKQFKGYSSKPDELINNPELGSVCQDMIINKGDLCNFPHTSQIIRPSGVLENDMSIRLSNFEDIKFILAIDSEGDIRIIDIDDNLSSLSIGNPNVPGVIFSEVLNWIGVRLRNDLSSPEFGRWIKSGDWYYLHINNGLDEQRVKQRMVRVKITVLSNGERFLVFLGLVGIMSPLFATTTTDLGIFTDKPLAASTYDFAFSFVLDVIPINSNIVNKEETRLSEDGVESNAIELKGVVTDGSTPSFRLYFQDGHLGRETIEGNIGSEPVNRLTQVAVYVREPGVSETVYRFLGVFSMFNTADTPAISGSYRGLRFGDIEVNNNVTNEDRNPSFTGKSTPWTCTHVEEFRGRYYRNTIGQAYTTRTSQLDSAGDSGNVTTQIRVKDNIIQVGPSFNEEFIGSGFAASDPGKAQVLAARHINYIDETLFFPVGQGPTTGIIEYLGQIIFFKKKETWVLTGTILDLRDGLAELRLLWNDLGCVTEKSQGYIVINSILYFAAQDGIYAFSGQGRPLKISTLIEEDLLDESSYADLTLSDHDRYNFMVVSFPKPVVNTYNFHYEEGGAWSIGTNSGNIHIDSDRQHWEQKHSELRKLLKINESSETVGITKSPQFSTGLITLGDDVRNKQWKEFTLETLTTLAAASSADYSVVFDSDSSSAVVSKTSQVVKRQHIGTYGPAIAMNLTMLSRFKQSLPFRVNGFSITGSIRGRR